MNLTDLIIGVISFVLTVMVFSYLFGDNFLFRLAMYLLIGISAGYTASLLILKVLIPFLITPLIEGTMQTRLWTLIPLTLSFILLLTIFPRMSHAGRIPLAFLVGLAAALTIVGVTLGTIIPQVITSINKFSPALLYQSADPPWVKIVDAIVMAVGAISALATFYFGRSKKDSQPTKRPVLIEGLGKLGQVFIGITLGALFAGVYSAALMALISRVSEIGSFFTKLISQ
ncbi:MAG: hypothetical protein MUO40_06540 [Anaerolineaceae bacterium]|nr:hypothetical protein [Anaerolineaceae bacterium]